MSGIEIVAGDLLLRQPEERDLPAVTTACRDLAIARFIPGIPVPYEFGHARGWLDAVARAWREADQRTFAIVDRETERLLGMVSVRLHEGGSVGYWLTPEARGRGVMTEAVTALVVWATTEQGIGWLTLTTHPANVASQRVAERAGFTRVGVVADQYPAFADGTTIRVLFELRSA